MPKLDEEQREKLRTWLRENDRRLWIEGTPFIDAACDAPRMNGLRPSTDQVRRYRPKHCQWKGRAAGLQHGDPSHTNKAWDKWQRRARPHLKDGRSFQEVARRCIDARDPVPLSALRGMMMPKGIKLADESPACPAADVTDKRKEV